MQNTYKGTFDNNRAFLRNKCGKSDIQRNYKKFFSEVSSIENLFSN